MRRPSRIASGAQRRRARSAIERGVARAERDRRDDRGQRGGGQDVDRAAAAGEQARAVRARRERRDAGAQRREAGGAAGRRCRRSRCGGRRRRTRAPRHRSVVTATAGPPRPSGAATRPVLWSTETRPGVAAGDQDGARRRGRREGEQERHGAGDGAKLEAGGERHVTLSEPSEPEKLRCTLARMTAPAPSSPLLERLLDGVHVVVVRRRSGDARGRAARPAARRSHALGSGHADEDALAAAVAALPGADVLVCDAGARCARAAATARRSAARCPRRGTRRARCSPGVWSPRASGMVVLRGAAARATASRRARRPRRSRTSRARRPWSGRGSACGSWPCARATSRRTPRCRTCSPTSPRPPGAYFSGCVLDLGAAGLTGYSSASS